MTSANQLPLSIVTDDEATLGNFQPRAGALEALGVAQSLVNGEAHDAFFAGVGGTGKSHLLQAVCHGLDGGALYIPLTELVMLPPEAVLDQHQAFVLLAIDDVHECLTHPGWQEALFHCFNQRRALGLGMLWSANTVPVALAGLLPDLQSRLANLTTYQLARQTEQELADMLAYRAGRRGLVLSPDVIRYVLARAPRSADALMDLLERLDRASLTYSRPITVPLIVELKVLSEDP
jgi:DnaA family protein